ncbi:MAG TPA: FRG domain-containing protein [Caulobacteraceae bacterium]
MKVIVTKRSPAEKWGAFLDFCNENARDNRWFRGVSNNTYALLPKVGRGHEGAEWHKTVDIDGRKINLAQREKRVFDTFRRRAHLGLATIPAKSIEWLALAQHHGVPTRLLDWTTNPLMAAWFATSSAHAKEEQVARVYCAFVSPATLVNEDDPDIFKWEGSRPKFMVAPHWHPRVRAQRGCFSIHPTPNVPYKPKDVKTFDIEQRHWGEFRKRLYYFGVDASTVMADLAGLGEALTWQYENRIGIGQVGY